MTRPDKLEIGNLSATCQPPSAAWNQIIGGEVNYSLLHWADNRWELSQHCIEKDWLSGLSNPLLLPLSQPDMCYDNVPTHDFQWIGQEEP